MVEMFLMCTVVLGTPLHGNFKHHPNYFFWWHALAAVWWLLLIMFALRYFEHFEGTGPLAFAIHVIMAVDMAPFACIYLVIFLCAALALRVSSEMTSTIANDVIVGSF